MTAPDLAFEVRTAAPSELDLVKRLLQLYMYDFSEFAGGVAGPDGLFHYQDDIAERWGRPWFHPFILWVLDADPRDGRGEWRPAGFAFVANQSYFSPEPAKDHWVMDDFFVMRKYRHAGVGTMLARWCFDTYPGRWEVGEMPQNTAAQAFWRRVIDEYTGGRYEDVVLDSDRWRGPVQIFRNG